MRKSLITATVLIAALVALLGIARQQVTSVDDKTLQTRYATGSSAFITIDGAPLHMRDEGEGPAIVLLHGSYGSLRMWDAWANVLKTDYRVIRFDIPPIGLSGPDPSDRYGYARAQELLGKLADQLGLSDFYLAGTSVGGAIAYRYAAANPDRVKRLLIATAPMLPLDNAATQGLPSPAGLRAARWFSQTFLKGYSSQYQTRLFLEHLFFDDSKVTPELTTEYTDYANRKGNKTRGLTFALSSQTTAQTAEIIASITVPTLVMWSANSPVLPLSHGEAATTLFEQTVPEFVVIPDCGHILPIEKGAETALIAQAFFQRDDMVAHSTTADLKAPDQ